MIFDSNENILNIQTYVTSDNGIPILTNIGVWDKSVGTAFISTELVQEILKINSFSLIKLYLNGTPVDLLGWDSSFSKTEVDSNGDEVKMIVVNNPKFVLGIKSD